MRAAVHKRFPGVQETSASKPAEPTVKETISKTAGPLATIGLEVGQIGHHVNQAARMAQQGVGTARRAEVSGLAQYYKGLHATPATAVRQQALTHAAAPLAATPLTPEALQTQLRARTQARGAQQLATAMGHAPAPGANPFRPMVAPPPILKTGSDEHPSIGDLKHLARTARRGDILVMSPKPDPGGPSFTSKAFNVVSRAIQGDLTHSAMYAGKGKVIDFRLDGGIHERPLADMAKEVDIAVVRPKVDRTEREQALARITDAMKRPKEVSYSVPQLFKTLASRVAPIGSDSTKLDNEICSTLISKSFNSKLVPDRARSSIVPSDFMHTPNARVLGLYRHTVPANA